MGLRVDDVDEHFGGRVQIEVLNFQPLRLLRKLVLRVSHGELLLLLNLALLILLAVTIGEVVSHAVVTDTEEAPVHILDGLGIGGLSKFEWRNRLLVLQPRFHGLSSVVVVMGAVSIKASPSLELI